jgi:RecB family exonuclease
MTLQRVVEDEIGYTPDEKGYILEGREYTRMTHVMSAIPKPWLDRWRERVDKEVGPGEAQRIAESTARAGDLIHLTTELYDLKKEKELWELIESEKWLLPYLWAWKEYVDTWLAEVLWVERVVRIDEPYRIAGRIDRLVMYRGDKYATLLDVKSTAVLSPSMGVQLYGYRLMIIEECVRKGLPAWMWPTRTVIAHLPGPRENDEETGRIFDKVKVKEYEWEKFREPYEECVNTYFALRE